MSIPAADLNNSPARCGIEPGPVEAKLSCPGFAFASASNSGIDFAGTLLATTSNSGTLATSVTGFRSFSVS